MYRPVPTHTATKLIVPPSDEPFSIDDAKAHCRIDLVTDDANVANWIRAARLKVERDTGRALLTQTWDLFLDGLYRPDGGGDPFWWGTARYAARGVCLPYPPLQSVTSVNATDTAGAETAWSSTNYVVDTASEPGRIGLADGGTWPSNLRAFQPIRIRFVAGWADRALIPDDLRQAVGLVIGWLSENRQPAAFESESYEQFIGNYVMFTAA